MKLSKTKNPVPRPGLPVACQHLNTKLVPWNTKPSSLDREGDSRRPVSPSHASLPTLGFSPRARHEVGGGERIRTDDPLLAKQVLSQLSYTPTPFNKRGGPR
jgi:hypothetical protein